MSLSKENYNNLSLGPEVLLSLNVLVYTQKTFAGQIFVFKANFLPKKYGLATSDKNKNRTEAQKPYLLFLKGIYRHIIQNILLNIWNRNVDYNILSAGQYKRLF